MQRRCWMKWLEQVNDLMMFVIDWIKMIEIETDGKDEKYSEN